MTSLHTAAWADGGGTAITKPKTITRLAAAIQRNQPLAVSRGKHRCDWRERGIGRFVTMAGGVR
jgi:hypothetical protein